MGSLGRATRLYVYRMPDVVPRAHGEEIVEMVISHCRLYCIFPAARLLPAPWPPAVVCSCLQREGRVSAHLCNVRIRDSLFGEGCLHSSWLGCHLWFVLCDWVRTVCVIYHVYMAKKK